MASNTSDKKITATNCEQCEHYVYDDMMDYYVCEVDLDQDEMEDFLNYNTHHCPYFRFADEYYVMASELAEALRIEFGIPIKLYR